MGLFLLLHVTLIEPEHVRGVGGQLHGQALSRYTGEKLVWTGHGGPNGIGAPGLQGQRSISKQMNTVMQGGVVLSSPGGVLSQAV